MVSHKNKQIVVQNGYDSLIICFGNCWTFLGMIHLQSWDTELRILILVPLFFKGLEGVANGFIYGE